jgi:hypothetical protein
VLYSQIRNLKYNFWLVKLYYGTIFKPVKAGPWNCYSHSESNFKAIPCIKRLTVQWWTPVYLEEKVKRYIPIDQNIAYNLFINFVFPYFLQFYRPASFLHLYFLYFLYFVRNFYFHFCDTYCYHLLLSYTAVVFLNVNAKKGSFTDLLTFRFSAPLHLKGIAIVNIIIYW